MLLPGSSLLNCDSYTAEASELTRPRLGWSEYTGIDRVTKSSAFNVWGRLGSSAGKVASAKREPRREDALCPGWGDPRPSTRLLEWGRWLSIVGFLMPSALVKRVSPCISQTLTLGDVFLCQGGGGTIHNSPFPFACHTHHKWIGGFDHFSYKHLVSFPSHWDVRGL